MNPTNQPQTAHPDVNASNTNGVGKQKLTPFTEQQQREADNQGTRNGNANNGRSPQSAASADDNVTARNTNAETVVPPDAGQRIPIPIREDANGTQASTNTSTTSTAQTTMPKPQGDSRFSRMAGAAQASISGVMTPPAAEADPIRDTAPQTDADDPEESVEERVNRLRPKSIRQQFRYLYTLGFMLWLFGRLVIWQVYVAKLFPNWVNSRNTQRWRKYAREFRTFALRMGGVQIKAGQFASTRADVLPEEVIAELAGLQDRVPTIDFKRIQRVLEEELGNIDERYDWIREDPVAAASLGQVHRAKLKDGERVVVKVQRPNVRDIVYTDMAALFIVAKVAMRFDFIRRRADAVVIVDEFGRVLLEEVSYDKEAENARRFKQMFADDMGVYVPRIYDKHSSDKVLTIEDVTSIKIDDFERLSAAGINRRDVAERLMDTYMQQIFEDRFFHADPHPGNLFVYPLPVDDPQPYIERGGGRPFYLVFIDFGMTGTLTKEITRGLINTLTAILTRDAKKLVASYQQLGFLMPNADTKRIEEATTAVFDEVWGLRMSDMRDIDFEVVEEIGEQFNDLLYDLPFRVPQDFVYLGRTVGILSGIATALDPEFNPWAEIQRNVQDFVLTDEDANIFTELGNEIETALQEIIAEGPQGFIRVAERFFEQFRRASRTERMLQQLLDGDIKLETRMSAQERLQLERIELQGKRTTRAFLFGSVLITATLLYTSGEVTLAYGLYGVAGVLLLGIVFVRQ